MKYSVVVTFSIEGFHCWPAAKDIFPEVGFLSDRHRHMFGFRCYSYVTHTDRDKEFILLKREIQSNLISNFEKDRSNVLEFGPMSCEAIGEYLLYQFPELYKVEVWEDFENGCVVERD